jgi:hypothetical protein
MAAREIERVREITFIFERKGQKICDIENVRELEGDRRLNSFNVAIREK